MHLLRDTGNQLEKQTAVRAFLTPFSSLTAMLYLTLLFHDKTLCSVG